jgi:hypothetical protein
VNGCAAADPAKSIKVHVMGAVIPPAIPDSFIDFFSLSQLSRDDMVPAIRT